MSTAMVPAAATQVAAPQFGAVAARIYATVDLGTLTDPMPLDDALALRESANTVIEDDLTYTRAMENWKKVKTAKKTLDTWAKPHKDVLNSAKDQLMSFINKYGKVLDEAENLFKQKTGAYKKQREDEAKRLREEAAAAAAPWEEPAPVAMVGLPQVAGMSERTLPAKAKIVDKRKALETALAEGNEWMLPFVEFDMPGLNTLAKKNGKELASIWPGIEAYTETTTAGR